MSDTPYHDTHFTDRIRAGSNWLFWVGLAMVVLGIVAIVFPMMSTLVAELMVGWMLLFSGGITLWGSFSIHGTGPFFGALLLGLLSVATGVFLLFHPLAGVMALTLLVAFILSLQGAVEVSFALSMRPVDGWVGVLLSGLASIVLAIVIAAGWPAISAVALGIILGVNFLTTGLSNIVLSRALRV
jgi:uncharacterized membrane protein HdeD (DUF308 family)